VRTTVRLDDELLSAAKRLAVETGRTLTAVIEDALRREVARRDATGADRPELPTFKGQGLRPGVDLDDTASLLDLMGEPTAPR